MQKKEAVKEDSGLFKNATIEETDAEIRLVVSYKGMRVAHVFKKNNSDGEKNLARFYDLALGMIAEGIYRKYKEIAGEINSAAGATPALNRQSSVLALKEKTPRSRNIKI